MNRRTLLYFFLAVFLISCTKHRNKNSNLEEVKAKIKQHLKENNLHPSFVLLVPEAGCPGCVSSAQIFLRQFSKNPNLYTILTKVVSKKDFEIKTNINLKTAERIYVDKDEYFSFKGSNSIYPAVFTLNKSLKITNVQFQKPGSDAIGKLSEKLDNNEI